MSSIEDDEAMRQLPPPAVDIGYLVSLGGWYATEPAARAAIGRGVAKALTWGVRYANVVDRAPWVQFAGPFEFERWFAATSGTTVAEMRRYELAVAPCLGCGDEDCMGWAVVPTSVVKLMMQIGYVPFDWEWPLPGGEDDLTTDDE